MTVELESYIHAWYFLMRALDTRFQGNRECLRELVYEEARHGILVHTSWTLSPYQLTTSGASRKRVDVVTYLKLRVGRESVYIDGDNNG